MYSNVCNAGLHCVLAVMFCLRFTVFLIVRALFVFISVARYLIALLQKQVLFNTVKKILVSKSEQTEQSFQQSVSTDQLVNKYQSLHDRAKVMSEIYCIV